MTITKSAWIVLLAHARCWRATRGRHDWKRALRTLGNQGVKQCRYCGTTREVTLRPRRTSVAHV